MWVRDKFGSKIDLQQAKSGKIVFAFGSNVITLSKGEAEYFSLYGIENFNAEAFRLAYEERPQNTIRKGSSMFLGLNNLNPEELAVAKWQYRLHGDFFCHLWEAISTADEAHLTKLEAGFPVEVSGYRKYISERGWWEAVQAKMEGPEAIRTPAFWSRKWHLTILDADGWQDKDIDEAITEKEFFDRASDSTQQPK